ncbi:MAG: hypothetical protein FWC78_06040 [Defluviitaleaceae bacterium]|nr:hypothetical protein [Defluviitaleaceae bacterium]
MRKIILQLFVAIILFSLVSCGGGSKAVYFDNAEYEPYMPREPIMPQEIPVEVEETIVNAEVAEKTPFEYDDGTTLPHPFAVALKAFMADYDGVVRAYLTTLDDDGTIGVFVRPTTKIGVFDYWYEEYMYIYRHFGTVFYIQDGELFQIDPWGFVAGRYNRLLSRYQAHTHIVEIIWKLEYGRWETSTRLEYFSDAYLFSLFNGSDNGFFDERNFDAERINYCDATLEHIAFRDTRAEYAREKYGLVALPPPNFGHIHNTEDHTAQILAMTINCVPSLSTATYGYRE